MQNLAQGKATGFSGRYRTDMARDYQNLVREQDSLAQAVADARKNRAANPQAYTDAKTRFKAFTDRCGKGSLRRRFSGIENTTHFRDLNRETRGIGAAMREMAEEAGKASRFGKPHRLLRALRRNKKFGIPLAFLASLPTFSGRAQQRTDDKTQGIIDHWNRQLRDGDDNPWMKLLSSVPRMLGGAMQNPQQQANRVQSWYG